MKVMAGDKAYTIGGSPIIIKEIHTSKDGIDVVAEYNNGEITTFKFESEANMNYGISTVEEYEKGRTCWNLTV